MKVVKSEPKLKYSVKKIQNYLPEKNFKQEMYMDDDLQTKGKLRGDEERKSLLSNNLIKTKTKLTYSFHERVDSVLSDSRKLGVLQREPTNNMRKSIAKINYTSTLPPIKTEQKQTNQHLVKVKNELNIVCQKNMKLQKQIHQLVATTRQNKEKIIFYKNYLNPDISKFDGVIAKEDQINMWLKYNQDVLQNMKTNFKNNSLSLKKQTTYKEEVLKDLKIQLSQINSNLMLSDSELTKNLMTRKMYLQKQKKTSEQFLNNSSVANVKLTQEHKAHIINQKYANEQGYAQDKYREQVNLQNHIENISKYRAQYALCQMVEALLTKYKLEFKGLEKASALIKMYSIRNYNKKAQPQSPKKLKLSMKSSIFESNRSLSKSMATNSTSKTKGNEKQFDIITAYNESFSVKVQLQNTIKDYQQKVKVLQKKHEKLFNSWVEVSFNDQVTEGKNIKQKKTDFSEQIKRICQRQKVVEENQQKMNWIKFWIKKQQDKLGVKISKKSTPAQFIKCIIQEVKQEAKNIEKEREEKQKQKQKVKVIPEQKSNKKKK